MDEIDIDGVGIFFQNVCMMHQGAFKRELRRHASFDCADVAGFRDKRQRRAASPPRPTPPPLPSTGGRWPTRFRTALADAPTDAERQNLEAKERQKQQDALAVELESLDLPVVALARQSVDPKAFLALAAGGHRAGTIRVRLQRWHRIRRWLVGIKGHPWPRSVVDLVDHLMDVSSQEGAPKSTPSQVAGSISFMEKVGGVLEPHRISLQPLWLAAVRDAEFRLQSGADAPRQAPRFTVSIIVGLEKFVIDTSRPLYKRFLAWTRLLKVWAALRSGDTEAIVPAALRWTGAGLEGTLERTKTSGPGKRARRLPFFVLNGAYLAEPTWLKTGFDLLAEGMAFKRDYLIPRPNADCTGPVKRMAAYTDRAAYGRAVLTDIDFGTRSGDRRLSSDATMYWTEHSERNFLVSVSAAFGFPKEQRDFLGRWRAGNQSDDYIRTARQLVGRIQTKVAARLRLAPDDLDDSQVGEGLAVFLTERGVSEEEVARTVALITSTPSVPTPTDLADSTSEDSVDGHTVQAADETPDELRGYWVSQSTRQGYRRLHRCGGCWIQPGLDNVIEEHLDELIYDSRCKLCYPQDRVALRRTVTSTSSTSSEGGSTSEEPPEPCPSG